MKCPQCQSEMLLKNQDVSFNYQTEPKKKYQRLVYWCPQDDILVNVESPLNKP